MNIAFKKLAGAGLAALTLAGSISVSSTSASAQYYHRHYHGGYRHHGPGVLPLVGGVVGGILGTAAAAASGGCWRHDGYGRAYRVC